jgi:glycosyltransferase involved in cell wall biosynthesis
MHGAAAVNAAMRELIREAGVEPITIDTAARNLDRAISARLLRIPRVIRGLTRVLVRRRTLSRIIYIGASGGAGQLYDILFILLARLHEMEICVHHHSFSYLDKYSSLMALLVRLAGPRTIHVTLSPEMANRLRALYRAECVIAVSNSAILLPKVVRPIEPRKRLRVLGFISNISLEKGIFEFLDLLQSTQELGLPIEGKIAGPFQDEEIASKVLARLRTLENVTYVGPKYGADKEQFYACIDALVFPSRYVHEAEPLTIHEAMMCAVPVVAYDRGAIAEIVSAKCGRIISSAEPFVPAALLQISAWLKDSAGFEVASGAAAQRFDSFRQTYKSELDALINSLVRV